MGQAKLIPNPFAQVPMELLHLIPGFLERREKEIIDLEHLLAERNYTAIKDLGHRLKGTGAGYGFVALSDLGRVLETAAKSENGAEIRATLDQLADEVGRLVTTARERGGHI
jgi:HPt (histidine-containing phosphotransfer) domain-containing protein